MNADPIADYLAELRAGLRTPPARTEEILAEAEDHLRESAAAVQRAGHLAEAAAQRAAIEAFGPAKRIIRAHRPPATAFAAAVGLRAWPLLGWYLVLSGVIAGLMLGAELLASHGRAMAPVTVYEGPGRMTVFALDGSPNPGQVAVTIGGCVIAGVLLLAGFLAVSRRYRSIGVPARLPRGLFALAAAFVLLALGIAANQSVTSYGLGALSAVSGSYELVTGSLYAAMLMGVGCGLWALNSLAGRGVRRREPVPGGDTARLTGAVARRSGYAAAIGMSALRLLGGYVLLSALMGGLLAYLDVLSSRSPTDFGELAAVVGGCALAGMVLLSAFVIVGRRRRRSGAGAAPLPRKLALPISVAALLALGVAEYLFFSGDVMGQLHIPAAASELLLGSQWAAVLMGAAWALRTLASLVSWVVGRMRASGGRAPTESGNLAPT